MTDAEMPPQPTGEMTLAEQRVAGCPIKPCRGADDNETMLRSIRSDRLLCMYCATRTPTGYMGREEARRHEDKFFKATNNDYVIQFAICAIGSAVATAVAVLIGFILFVFFIGAGAGGAIGIAGVALGALVGPIILAFLRSGRFVPRAVFGGSALILILICAGIMAAAVYGLMRGRI